jgi:prevent-host-death family protein
MDWILTDAEARLAELLDRSQRDGPQTIRHMDRSYVILPVDEYKKLVGSPGSFKAWLTDGPGLNDIDVDRKHSVMKESDL